MSAHHIWERGLNEFGTKPGTEILKASKISAEQLDPVEGEHDIKARIAKAVEEVRSAHYGSDLLDSLVRGVRGSELSRLTALLTAILVFSSSLEKTNPEHNLTSAISHPSGEDDGAQGHILKIARSFDKSSTPEPSRFITAIEENKGVASKAGESGKTYKSVMLANSDKKELANVPLSEDSSLAGNEYARTYEPKGDISVSDTADKIEQLLQSGAKKVSVKITGYSSFEHGGGTKKEEEYNFALSRKRGAKGERKLIEELQKRGVDMGRVEIATKAGGPRIRVEDKDYSEPEAVQHLMGVLGKTEKQVRKLIKKYNRNSESVDAKTRGLLDNFLAKNRSTVFDITSVGDVVVPPADSETETVVTPPPTKVIPKPTPAPFPTPTPPAPAPSPKPDTGGAQITALSGVGGDKNVEWFARDPEEEELSGLKPKKTGESNEPDESDDNKYPNTDASPVISGDLPPGIIKKTAGPDIFREPKPKLKPRPEPVVDITPGFSDKLPKVPDEVLPPPPKRRTLPEDDSLPVSPYQPTETTPRTPPEIPDKPPAPLPLVSSDRPPVVPTPWPILPDKPPYIPPVKPGRTELPPNPPPPPPPQPPERHTTYYSGQQSVERQPMGTPTRTAKKDLLGGVQEGSEKQTGRGKVTFDQDQIGRGANEYAHADPLKRREFVPNVEERHQGDRGIRAKIRDQWEKVARKFKRNQRGD